MKLPNSRESESYWMKEHCHFGLQSRLPARCWDSIRSTLPMRGDSSRSSQANTLKKSYKPCEVFAMARSQSSLARFDRNPRIDLHSSQSWVATQLLTG